MSTIISLAMIIVMIARTVRIAGIARIVIATYSGIAGSKYWGKLFVAKLEKRPCQERRNHDVI